MPGKDVAVATPSESSAIEQYMAEFAGSAPVGLEDVGSEDVSIAVIKVDHADGVFVDSLTGETHETLDCILLGLLKQRVLWDPDPENKSGPLCKSRDGNVGHPRENFPWPVYKSGGGPAVQNSEEVACSTCALQKWGSHPNNDTPWCTAQYTFPVVIGDASNVSGLLSFQRSGLAPARQYISGFVRDKMPLFAVRTTIALEQNRKGTVKYATPKFVRGVPVQDVEMLRAYAAAFEGIKAITGNSDVSERSAVVPDSPAEDRPF